MIFPDHHSGSSSTNLHGEVRPPVPWVDLAHAGEE